MKIATQSPSIHTIPPSHAADTSGREAVNSHHNALAPPTATPALPRGMKTSHPAWLKEAMFRDDTSVRTEDELARTGDRHSSQPWVDDQSGADRAMDAFRASLYRHLTHRWANDRSAAADQIGTANYAEIRRQELEAIPGAGYLAKQYGLQTAADNTPQWMQPGLRIANPLSAKYQRDHPNDNFHEDCLRVYRSLGHDHPSDKVLFVNSEANASRILEKLGRSNFAMCFGLKDEVQPLAHGLVAIEFGHKSLVKKAQKLVERLGGRPSSYEVSKLACMSPSESSVRLQNDVDNAAALRDLFQHGKAAISTLRSLPDGHAQQAVARCAASLLGGLEKTLSPKADTPEFKHDLLIANALNALANMAHALPALTEDSTRFAAGYAALLEEVQILLAAVKPYEESDFKKAVAAMLETRAGSALASLQIATPETWLVSSGMEAISTGVDIAKILSDTRSVQFLANQIAYPDYFETLSLASQAGLGDTGRIRMAPLNPNLPGKKDVDDTLNNWNAEKLVELSHQWLGAHKMSAKHPAVLVLDATIEQQKAEGTSDLAMVLDDLAPYIKDGRLKIVLCKSYQKYTSLGSAKIMAGGITLIGKDDDKMLAAAARLREAEKDLGWIRNDESQLLTHFITHAHDSELRMIGQAAQNAAFIHRFCFEDVPLSRRFFVRHEEGLPFVVTNAGFQEIMVAKKKTQSHLAGFLLLRQAMPRDSFAFLSTSCMSLVGVNKLRIAAGQETREELVEKLYAFAWLAKSRLQTLTPVEVAQQAKHIAADATRYVLDHADVKAWAPAALQVLRERASRGALADATAIGKCEGLLADVAQEDVLRKELKRALNTSQPQADSLLAEQLRIVGSAFAPRLTDSALHASDVDAMRTAIRSSPDGSTDSMVDAAIQARFAPNAIASLLAMAGLGLGPEEVADDFRAELESFYRAALSSGLPNVSPSTRECILYDWSWLHAQKLEAAATDPQAQRAAVHELIRHAQLSPYRETRAKMFASFPDGAFGSLERPVQRQLTDALFGPLDALSRLEFIRRLAMNRNVAKLGSCLERFGEDLKQADEGGSTLLFPDGLSGKVERPADQPRPITPEKSADIRKHLLLAILPDSGKHEGFGHCLASLAPWICNDAATASRLADIARACEAAQSADTPLSDVQRQALSGQVQLLPAPYREVMQQHLDKIVPRNM